MFLIDPSTGEPSVAFTLYAMECEGEFDNEQEEEDVDDDSLDDPS
jgi:hypothetical protein